MRREHLERLSEGGANHKKRGSRAVIWDDSGKIRRLITPSNPEAVPLLETAFEYDEQERLTETSFVSEGGGMTNTGELNAFLAGFRNGVVYDGLGRVKALTLGGIAHTEYEYDEANLISSITYGAGLGIYGEVADAVGLEGGMERKRHYKNGKFVKSEYRPKRGGAWKKLPDKGSAISADVFAQLSTQPRQEREEVR
jgi:hypothetical protein